MENHKSFRAQTTVPLQLADRPAEFPFQDLHFAAAAGIAEASECLLNDALPQNAEIRAAYPSVL